MKHNSCNCRCKFLGRKCNFNQKLNNDKCRYECKNPIKYCVCKEYYVCNPCSCTYEMDGYMKLMFI